MDEPIDSPMTWWSSAAQPRGSARLWPLGRARRTVLVVDADAPRNAPAGHVHNDLGREGTAPRDLLAGRRPAPTARPSPSPTASWRSGT